MSRNASIVSAALLALLVTVMSGGGFLLEQTMGRAAGFIDDPAVAALQRAGHGHAGVLIVLALWTQIAIDRLAVGAVIEWCLRLAFPLAAALMSGGFFLSAAVMAGSDAAAPSLVLRAGAVVLGLSLLTLAALLIFRRQKN
ncbi:MAG: hypothetical protein QNJ84_07060 [Alphaproteobacteria bacterium]|nr:hypothetical protein [Alphaproteobacteria bacterium]